MKKFFGLSLMLMLGLSTCSNFDSSAISHQASLKNSKSQRMPAVLIENNTSRAK